MALFDIENLRFAYPDESGDFEQLYGRGSTCDQTRLRDGLLNPVLDEVSFSIERGSFNLVMGRSGSGKTTLLRHLKSDLAPNGVTFGRVLFEGRELSDVPEREQVSRIGFIFQDPESQICTDKVWHELAFGLENLGIEPDQMRSRVAEMANFFGMQQWFRRDVADLSGGQKQMLSIASVLILGCDVLILDEPCAQLDPIASSELLDMLVKANRELGCTVVMSAQRVNEVFPYTDKVILLSSGRASCVGSAQDVSRMLIDSDCELAPSLPAATRIASSIMQYLEDITSDEALEESCQASSEFIVATSSPLTVRDGRRFLEHATDFACSHRWVAMGSDAPKYLPDPPDTSDHAIAKVPTDLHSKLILSDVWFRYSRHSVDILRGVTLALNPGKILAVVGGNGCGKTTLLKVACKELRAYRGKVANCDVSMVPQDVTLLLTHKTVSKCLDSALSCVSSTQRSTSSKKPRAMAERFGIEHLLERDPLTLSGGERQLVAIAMAVSTGADVLLLDEPTKGLDVVARRNVANVLKRLADSGTCVVFVSHDIEFCAQTSDETAMLFDGQIVSRCSTKDFFASNSFYTTDAHRIAKDVFPSPISVEDVVLGFKRLISCQTISFDRDLSGD